MRMVLFLAIVANSADLIATAFGIHWLGNREGNPLLVGLVHRHWWLFVPFKGLVIPLLILRLDCYRQRWPAMASTGMVLVACALTVAVGRWLGWIGGVLSVHGAPPF